MKLIADVSISVRPTIGHSCRRRIDVDHGDEVGLSIPVPSYRAATYTNFSGGCSRATSGEA
jgi:hypothetical protein